MLRELNEIEFVKVGYYINTFSSNKKDYGINDFSISELEKLNLKDHINVFQVDDKSIKIYYNSEVILNPYKLDFKISKDDPSLLVSLCLGPIANTVRVIDQIFYERDIQKIDIDIKNESILIILK